MEQMKSLTSLLTSTTPVVIVANENVEGKPIVTPLLDNEQNPRTDMLGKPLGSIRLQQTSRNLANGSFLNVRNRVAFISGTLDALHAIVNENKLVDGSVLPGKIYVSESLEPFWKNQQPKMNPQTEEVIGVTIGDRLYPVFLKMTYTEDNTTKDTFIRTPEDVMAWIDSRKALAALSTPVAPETAGMPIAPVANA